jgi:hypothetical protein
VTRRRLIPLAVGVIGLLAVVALAARGRPLRANGAKNAGLPMTFWDYAFTTVVILCAAGALVSLCFYLMLRGADFQPRRPSQARTLRSVAIIIVVCAFVALVGHYFNLFHFFHRNASSTPHPAGGPGAPHNGKHVIPTDGVRFQWPELAVFGLLLALGVLYATRSRVRALLNPGRSGAEELAAALDESLDDLHAEPDLRRAIVAAYARMETALAAAGYARRPAEAPREYLERVLLSLDTSATAVRRLTDLFEWARFSHHEPEPGMRDEAIASLADVRDELRADAPVLAA